MPRYALLVEYDGRPFAGWQRQAAQPSVQQAIEEALARLEPGPFTIAGAGRTDAGVHARGQVAQCDMAKDWDPFRLSEALNFHLKPAPVAIRACARVADDWHARFSAVERRYLFRILMRRAPATLEEGQVCQFLTMQGCNIHEAKPKQCHTYPFWKENLQTRFKRFRMQKGPQRWKRK